jgi:hypothetical protein
MGPAALLAPAEPSAPAPAWGRCGGLELFVWRGGRLWARRVVLACSAPPDCGVGLWGAEHSYEEPSYSLIASLRRSQLEDSAL